MGKTEINRFSKMLVALSIIKVKTLLEDSCKKHAKSYPSFTDVNLLRNRILPVNGVPWKAMPLSKNTKTILHPLSVQDATYNKQLQFNRTQKDNDNNICQHSSSVLAVGLESTSCTYQIQELIERAGKAFHLLL